ncbi:alpha/beta hydrolase family protein [Corynebacterium guangdongense]|uniref:Pimeloyl-ACP methyl ester carboxylesterase n=1 Tax=Corynebacterium guangdongense TaxID=1783348 RepID=A0ABU1ZY88_9CORY|nr:hypothetical protein [Corynebacterium guangdongense]MDR7329896.1 pimeloyl-ACP methyl ester carboxylesterase [Corynebacterium guangdongense]WJZ18457.1 hypothetical protein CGUA_09490 [Corynebacterium guangdongense]
MQKRVLGAARATLGKWWSDYLQKKDFFVPSLDLTTRPRNNTVAVDNSRSFADVNAFHASRPSSGVSTVWHRGLPIDMSMSLKKGAPLIVVFHGATNVDVRLPWLSGLGITAALETSRLSISDPSLYMDPDLNLSWFSGSHIQPDLIDVLAQIIKKVTVATSARRIVLFGGSGGGYISLRLIEYFPWATAVVMNPQTDIEKYHEKHVQRYVDLAWKGDRNLLRSSSGTTVFDSVEAAKGTAKVVYLQNSNDTFHLAAHLAPFRERFGGTERFILLEEAWRDGHTPPPKEDITKILSAAAKDDWQALTDRLGFKQL